MKKIGFGILGSGAISRQHIRALSLSSGAYLVGIYSADTKSAAVLAEENGVRHFETLRELIDCREIEVVNICTPSGTHAELAIQLLECGKHVMVEKPLALTPADASAVTTAATKSGKLCAVFSQLRFFDAIQKVRKALEEGLLGRIVMVSASMKYYRSKEYYSSSPWKGTWSMDGGALMNQGIHGIDLLRYLVGEVATVSAFSKTLCHDIEADDTTAAILEFANGAIGTVENTTSVAPGYPRIIDINGTEGSIRLEENNIVRWDVKGETCPTATDGNSMSGARDPDNISYIGHLMQIENMVGAIRGEESLVTDAKDAQKTVELISAIYRSAAESRKISVEKSSTN